MYFNTVAPPSQSGIPKFFQGTGLEVVDYVSVGTISTKMLIYIAYYYGCFVVGLTLAYMYHSMVDVDDCVEFLMNVDDSIQFVTSRRVC